MQIRKTFLILALGAVLVPATAGAETRWTTNYGPVTLPDQPSGNVSTIWGPWRGKVTGSFSSGSEGPTLRARHIGSFRDIPCVKQLNGAWYWGDLTWVFDRGYTRFRGTFNRCGEGEENEVTGRRD